MNLKNIINDIDFHINTGKETFTLGDVLEMQKQWKAKFTGVVATHVKEEFDKITTEDKDLRSQYDELKKEKDQLQTEYERLNGEFSPIKEKMRTTSAQKLLEGKVNTGAEMVVFEQLENNLPENFETLAQEELDKLLAPIFESSPYLKPVVVEPKSDDTDGVVRTPETETETDPEFTSSYDNFGYNG